MNDPNEPSGVIDIQTHYIAPSAARILTAYRERGGIVHGVGKCMDATYRTLGLEERLRAMDAAGIDVSVLNFAPVGTIQDTALGADLCRAANDGLLEACATHSGRFVMAASLPLPDDEGALAELRRVAGEDALRAVQIVAQTTLYEPDAPRFADLFAYAAKSGLPVIIHPSAGVADLAPQFDAYGLSSGMHAMVSSALVTGRMILSGMMDRIEGLELIVTHLGGVLPFLIDRIDSRANGPAAFPPSYYLRTRVYLDACGYPAGPALRCAIETIGADRVLFGSDWPYRPIAPALDAIRALGLDCSAEQAILRENAGRWFDPRRPRRTQ